MQATGSFSARLRKGPFPSFARCCIGSAALAQGRAAAPLRSGGGPRRPARRSSPCRQLLGHIRGVAVHIPQPVAPDVPVRQKPVSLPGLRLSRLRRPGNLPLCFHRPGQVSTCVPAARALPARCFRIFGSLRPAPGLVPAGQVAGQLFVGVGVVQGGYIRRPRVPRRRAARPASARR